MIAPMIWKIIYMMASFPFMRPARYTPKVMAGLIWHPDIPPMAYAIATTDRPKAKATPSVPTPSPHEPATSPVNMALPHPMITSTMVPINSAKYFFIITLFNV